MNKRVSQYRKQIRASRSERPTSNFELRTSNKWWRSAQSVIFAYPIPKFLFILTTCFVIQSAHARMSRGSVSRGSIRHSSSYGNRPNSHPSYSTGHNYTRPSTRPTTKPVTRPATRPTVKPSTRPVTRPERPVTKPTQPITRPNKPVTRPEKPINKPRPPSHPVKPRPPGYRPPAHPVKPRPPGYRPPPHGGNGGGYHNHNHWHDWNDARRDWMRFYTINNFMRCGSYWSSYPTYSTTVVVSGITYYYWGGLYYIKTSSGYIVVTPPPGAVVYAIPLTATPVVVENSTYYYYGGTYYEPSEKTADIPDQYQSFATTKVSNDSTGRGAKTEKIESPEMTSDDSNYEVVTPPAGATVPYLPEDAIKKVIEGKTYFIQNTTWYRPYSSDGDTIYRVVAKP